MASSAVFKLESLLEARRLDRTLAREPASPPPVQSTGIARLDAVLDGGWRQGEVSEVVGPRSSGRTSLLVATMASATAGGGIVGLVDAVDRFDSAGAASAGVDLDRMAAATQRAPPCLHHDQASSRNLRWNRRAF